MTTALVPSDFLDEVRKSFSGLVDQGRLSVVSSLYDAETFGNAVVILESKNFRVRVFRDRGETFADLAGQSAPDCWHFYQRVLNGIGLAKLPKTFQISPDSVARSIEQNYSLLNNSFDAPQFALLKKQLDEIAEAAGQEMLRRLKAGIPLD